MEMSPGERAQALLDLIEQWREAECARLTAAAGEERARILHQAQREARQRVRATLEAERERARSTHRTAQARLSTAKRLHRQRAAAALLRQGWDRLPRALAERWARPGSRADWIECQLGLAHSGLAPADWTIHHGTDWGEADTARARDWAGRNDVAGLAFVADPRIDAGFRVEAAGVWLDATPEGLLSDRTDIEGRLLEALGEFP